MPLVLITGGGKRLGRGLAIEFSKKQWDVAILYNSSEEEAFITLDYLKTFGTRVIAVKANVSVKDEVIHAIEKVVEQIGVPDVLVNNAGVFPELLKLKDISENDWDSTIDINTKGAFLCSQAFSAVAEKGSRIINIASLGGLEIWSHRIPYNVSKSALIHLTKALARELAPDISVNCINPGTIVMPDEPTKHDATLIDINKIPMKRFGNVKDVFDAVWFFANCSSYITGQQLNIDGGYHDAR